ncbi:BIR-domain-containing protein [Piedraia hortae CBS 480.64]|uniref:BIR-domain-containing protein n=1 Tax=Piedraia hortae CBS 480.64 TaxID=1314780 RepID=A0A6A7CD04_9PEZI|nr:BIR-domain-containing protein [Piedraia hortae CBS 480.64]
MGDNREMRTYAARLATFQSPRQLSKRRASSQSKRKGANVIEWPHDQPAVEELARAGFYYRPEQDAPDNVACFCCGVRLDGWEPEDDPLQEHRNHSPTCAWAANLFVERDDELRQCDPMSEELIAARRGTFDVGDGWVHENKRGWRCKVKKMVEAGWTYDPSPENDDGVVCLYCNLSLDGWEPKDEPWDEHHRRSPDCLFFELYEKFYAPAKTTKTKGRGKVRVSAQSNISATNSVESESRMDDSIMSTATTASKRGGKKGGRKPAAKSRKRAGTVDSAAEICLVTVQPEPKPIRKRTRQSKQADTSMVELSQLSVEPKTRGRKAVVEDEIRSDGSQQLQDEMELSIDFDAIDDENTPQPPKRGSKRLSNGTIKSREPSVVIDNSVAQEPNLVEEATSPSRPIAPIRKRGRAASRQVSEAASSARSSVDTELPEPPMRASKSRKGPAKKKDKARKTSSMTDDDTIIIHEPRDLEAEEAEIERELAQLEQEAVQEEQERAAEYEPTPSRRKKVLSSSPSPQNAPPSPFSVADGSATPYTSDKENQPSYSETAATVNVAPGTPIRPSALTLALASPSKQPLAGLKSTVPWDPMDLDDIFASPEPSTPATLARRIAAETGTLSTPEKSLTVEQWIYYRAEQGEQAFRRRCEEAVVAFEREGVKALECLRGVKTR